MKTMTESKNKIGKNYVMVPRALYKEFMRWREMIQSIPSAKATVAEKKAIAEGLRALHRDNYISLEEFKKRYGC